MPVRIVWLVRVGPVLLAALFAVLLVSACTDKQMEPARQAIAEVEAALKAAGTEPAKYMPGRLKDVMDEVADLKLLFEQKDYAGVLAASPAALAAAKALPAEAAQRKGELLATLAQEWTTLEAAVPVEIEAVRRQVKDLTRSRKLPEGSTPAMLEAARTGIDDARALWDRAVAEHDADRLEEALTFAGQARQRASSLGTAIGMAPPGEPVE
jgi:hypothetical protein